MFRWQRYQRDLLILVGFLILPFLLYGNVTLGERTMLPVDNLYQWAPWSAAAAEFGINQPQNALLTDLIIENYAWKRFIITSLRDGELPLWNPYLFAGAPFLAAGQHFAYYPFSILFLIMPLTKAYGWYTVSQLWLAGTLMYFLGRSLGMRRSSAAMAGLIYQGSGFMLVSAAVFPMIVGAAIWLPFLLACIEKIITTAVSPQNKYTLPWVVAGSIGLGIHIFAGHIEFTLYTLLVMALFAAWRLGDNYLTEKRPLRQTILPPSLWLTGMVTLGLMLGAVQLIPLYELANVNFRQDSPDFAEVQEWAFPSRRLLTLALPNFYGNPSHYQYEDVFTGQTVTVARPIDWGFKNYVEGGIYLGILPLFFSVLGLYGGWRAGRKRRGHLLFFGGMAFFSLTFIFGTPLYALIYYGLPFADQLHTPFRWVFPLSLCVAILAGFGVDYVSQSRQWPSFAAWQAFRQQLTDDAGLRDAVWASHHSGSAWIKPLFLWGRPSLITGLAGSTFWGGLLLIMGLFGSRAIYDRIAPLLERIFLGLAKATEAFTDARAFYSYEFRQLYILGLMLIAVGTVLRVSRCPIFVGRNSKHPIWLIMAAVTLTLDIFLANVGFHPAVDPALLEHTPALVQWLEQQPGQWRLTSYNPRGDKPFNANSGWLYDFEDVRGYDSIIPKQYTNYMAAIEPQNELQFNRVQPIAQWQSLNSPLLDVLNVRYIITAETVDLPKLQEVWQGEGLRVYENLAVAPRAYTLPFGTTAVSPDPLTAMTTQFDPRQFVVIDQDEVDFTLAAAPTGSSYQAATIDEYRRLQVTVNTVVTERSWLVLNDSHFPGWKAFVRSIDSDGDEEELPIYRVNGNFRGVLLEAGAWQVRFRYSPLTFQLGGLTSAMAGLILLFSLIVWGWQRLTDTTASLSTTRSLLKNSGAPMVLNLFNKFIDFIFAAFYLRVLGPTEAGSYTFAITATAFFDIIANFGLNILLIREVSQAREQAGQYLLNTTLLRLGTGLLGVLPIAIYIATIGAIGNPPTPAQLAAIIFIMIGMVFSGMSQGVTGLFYVHEQAEVPAAMTTATTILKVGLGVAALLLGTGFVGLAAVSIIVNIVTLITLTTLALRAFTLQGPWRIDWRLQRQMLKQGYPLMLIHLLQTIFISVDVLLLRQINGETVVGWYSSAYKWFNALQIVPSFFTLALFPIISRAIKEDMATAQRMYRLSLKLMLLLALPIAVITTFAADFLVALVGGDAFLPHGAIALQVVMWAIPIGWLNSVTNYVLIGLGLDRLQPRAFTIAVLFNIIANLLFLPRYSYVAAAVTTILSEVVLLVLFHFYLRQRMPHVGWRQLLTRPLLITVVMVAVMWAGMQVHLIVALLLGAVVYPAGLLLLGVFGPEERQVLANILPTPLQRFAFND